MANESNDLDGPVYVRKLIENQMAARGYAVVPPPEVDEKLRAQGFTDGGQLGAASPEQLGQWLDADGLFYSTLENFDYIDVGFYWQRRVTIKARLVNARTGEKVWEAERSWSTRGVAVNKKEAERQFAIQLAAKAAEKMMHTPLQPESRMAVGELLRTLPIAPYH